MTQDEKYMKEAIKQAKKAYALEEVPIGCVIVQNDKIIARGYNRRNTDKNALSHAEISAIKRASKKTGDWRLEDCTLYVTLEPCPMCAWAILQSRIKTLYFGSFDKNYGAFGSAMDLRKYTNSKLKVYGGIKEEECDKILEEFFKKII